jgi:hypothetical protein
MPGAIDLFKRQRGSKSKQNPMDEASERLIKVYRFLQHTEGDFNTQVARIRDRKRFFEAAKSGSPDDILLMLEVIHKDYER